MNPPNKSETARESAQEYLQRTGIISVLEDLTAQLLRELPENPLQFLIARLQEISTNQNCAPSRPQNSPRTQGRPVFLTDGEPQESRDFADKEEVDCGDMDKTDFPANRTSSSWFDILRGCLKDLPPLPSNIVRVFLSSTFSDFKAERTVLPRTAYPQLQQFCSERGLDFQVVDMRWGVTDEMVNDHMTSAICLREITLCQKLSQGPCFVAMLGHRYGYQPIPSVIEADEFQILLHTAKHQHLENIDVFQTWYIRDNNAIPPVYCLQPISDILPNYNNMDPKQRQSHEEAKATWGSIYRQLQTILRTSAEAAMNKGCLTPERKRKYFMSVTEEEIQQGILMTSSLADSSLCYVRELEGIKNVPLTNATVTRYLDILEQRQLDEISQELLSDLVNRKLPTKLMPEHFKSYRTKWTGTPLENLQEEVHKNYLDKFCKDFIQDVQTMVSERRTRPGQDVPHVDRDLYLEVLQHAKFCLRKSEVFCGQNYTIDKVKIYLDNLDKTHMPLVVHGKSGSGKTSLLAYIAKIARDKIPGVQAVVIRFLGTSPWSSSIKSSLLSVTKQLCRVYGFDASQLNNLERMSEIRREFTHTLQKIGDNLSTDKKLLLILDSIDQLSTSFGSHQMHWLPRLLPHNVGMIISMLTDRYSCYIAARQRLRDPDCFLELTEMPTSTGEEIVRQYLKNQNRTITSFQRTLIMEAFGICRQPLFLKLLLDEARQWKSYTCPSEIQLMTSIQAAIHQLFEKLEEQFGAVFVRAALGYLTCGKDGLTGIELEDVLSCDNDVLDEVYAFHDPPMTDVIRLPSLLWARLQNEINEYLVERTADGKTVMAWYHRLFWETATSRFVESQARKVELHTRLAEVFRCEHTVRKTIVLQKRSSLTMLDADRQVTPQPLTVQNVRKLSVLPYHLFHSGQFEELKTRCLLDFNWIITKVRAVTIGDLTNEYETYCSTGPLSIDGEVCLMKDFLQLAYEPLREDPLQLAYQVIQRLEPLICRYASLATFVDSAKLWTEYTETPLLLPVHNTNMKSPESALICSLLAGNTGIINRFGEIAICGFLDKLFGKFKVQIWNLSSKDVVESVPSKPNHPFVMSGDSNILAIVAENTVTTYDTCSGDMLDQFRYRHDRFQKCDIKSVCVDENGTFLVIGSKLGEKAKGSGIRYRSTIHRINLKQSSQAQMVEYSAPGFRCLEHMVLAPGEQKLIVINFAKITVFDANSLTVCRTFEVFSEIKADTFCFADSGQTMFGTFGGFNTQNSKILVVDLDTGDVEVSEALFEPIVTTEMKETLSMTSSESDIYDSETQSEAEAHVICRAFALRPNPTGSLILAGVSTVGSDRRNCITLWRKDDGQIERLELPERTERFPKCLAAFPDWRSAVVGWDDGLMMFVDLTEMTVTREMKAHEMSINVVQMIPQKGHLVSIGTDRNLKIWDIDHLQKDLMKSIPETLTNSHRLHLDEHEQVVDYSSVDSMVVTAPPYPTSPPRLWSTITAQPCVSINTSIEEGYNEIYPEKSDTRKDVNLTFIHSGRYLVDVRRRRAEAVAHVIDVTDDGVGIVSRFETHNPHLIFKDKYFFSIMFGELVIRELPTGSVFQTVEMSPWPGDLVKDHINIPPQIFVTSDQKYFVFVNLTGSEKYMEIVDLKAYSVVCKTDIRENLNTQTFLSTGFTYLLLFKDNTAMISSPEHMTSLSLTDVGYKCLLDGKMISNSGKLGVTLQSSPNSYTLWNATLGTLVYKTEVLPQKIHCICFAPNERYLLCGSYNVVSLWSLEAAVTLSKIHTYGAVCSLSFTPSGAFALIHCYAAPKRKRLIICRALHMDS